MKLHLPIFLRKAVLACFTLVSAYTLHSGSVSAAADLTLGSEDTLTIDYASADSITDLQDGTLQLDGAAKLLLSNCGEGDGRAYTLMTGVSSPLDAEGNVISLDDTNNAASLYFDTSQPGTGFWADAKLQLSADGSLQLVRYTDISIPEGYTEVVVDSASDIAQYSGESDQYVFRLTKDITIADRTSTLTIEDAWYFTSDSVDNLVSLTFRGNTTSSHGGAIYGGSSSTITLSGNKSVTFSGNTAEDSAGAIYGGSSSTITLSENGSVTFSGNSGGAIHGSVMYGTIELSGNGSVEFSGNSASSYGGGAIKGDTITLSNNGSVTFSGNTASTSDGGAIHGDTITLSNNGSVEFSGNTAAYGGAIYGWDPITLSGNGSVTFSRNTAFYGGAIYGCYPITLSDNDSVTFSGNSASTYGGAIYGDSNSTITLSGNESVTFSGNTAEDSAGAIYGGDYSTITLSGNESVIFSENSAFWGGAIKGSTITLSDNGSVEFSGNTISTNLYQDYAYGGAIYFYEQLNIQNNDTVLFEKNAEIQNGSHRLRSIYDGGIGAVISFSAAADKSIEFRDSVYISSTSTLKLNEKFGGIEQKGDIIFTGKYTETHLKEILEADNAGRTATTEEIQNSRINEINGEATLYGGTLRVEDAAVLKLSGGLTVEEGSNASVKVHAAEMSTGSHSLNMVAGSSLVLSDGARLTTTELTITTGATLAVLSSVSTELHTERVAALTLDGETVAGFDASRAVNTGSVSVLEGDLTLEVGSLLSFEDAYLELTGDLIFDVAADDEKIELDIVPGIVTDDGCQVVLFQVGGDVTFTFDGLTASSEDGLVYRVQAIDYFFGSCLDDNTELVYDSDNNIVYLENAVTAAVPEPTTATLSLLALAALAARRRRK